PDVTAAVARMAKIAVFRSSCALIGQKNADQRRPDSANALFFGEPVRATSKAVSARWKRCLRASSRTISAAIRAVTHDARAARRLEERPWRNFSARGTRCARRPIGAGNKPDFTRIIRLR